MGIAPPCGRGEPRAGRAPAPRPPAKGRRRLTKFTPPSALRDPRLLSPVDLAYMKRVRITPDYGDKRARNKRTGPGCDSRRLHQFLPPALSAGPEGPISIDRRLNALLFPGVAHRFGP